MTRRVAVPPGTARWVAEAVGGPSARVVRCSHLPGGIQSAVHAVDVQVRDRVVRVVLKRWVEGAMRERRQSIVREARVLRTLETAGVAAPRYLASDDGTGTGGTPALLMSRLPGRVWLAPTDMERWVGDLARTLARLHDIAPPAGLPHSRRTRRAVAAPPDSRRPALWRAVAELLDGPAPRRTGFIHGDYQHFNVLWHRGRLSGVIDWTWAGRGHPDRDVGHCRLNLAVLFSAAWAQRFGQIYETEAGRTIDPWWDTFEISRYDEDWQRFIPIQVAGRAPVDATGMTPRVEQLLARTLA